MRSIPRPSHRMHINKYNKRWHRRKMLFNTPVPANVKPWLFDVSSLTLRLLQRCPDKFRVELISQSVKKPTLDEARILHITPGRASLIREVLLRCDDNAVIYARTVIPLSTLTGAQRRYANLGERPLGAMLFADRTMQRDEVEIAMLMPGDALYKNTQCTDELIWGRRSIFRVSAKPLLVAEFFLPALFK